MDPGQVKQRALHPSVHQGTQQNAVAGLSLIHISLSHPAAFSSQGMMAPVTESDVYKRQRFEMSSGTSSLKTSSLLFRKLSLILRVSLRKFRSPALTRTLFRDSFPARSRAVSYTHLLLASVQMCTRCGKCKQVCPMMYPECSYHFHPRNKKMCIRDSVSLSVRAGLALFGAVLLWSSSFIALKIAVSAFDPMVMVCLLYTSRCV